MDLKNRVWLISALCAGSLLGCLFAENLPWLKSWPLFLIGLSACLILVWPQKNARIIVVCLIGIVGGHLIWQNANRQYHIAPGINQTVTVVGWVTTLPQSTALGDQVIIEVESLTGGQENLPFGSGLKIATTIPADSNLFYGDEIKFDAKPYAPVSTDQFDSKSYWRVRGVQLQATAKSFELVGHGRGLWIYRQLYGLKNIISTKTNAILNGQEGALLLGILFGNSGQLSKEIATQFRQLGISHITAVSGYNLTIISLWPLLLAGLIPKRSTIGFSAVMVGLFVIFTGAPASIVRAAIMAWVMLFGKYIGRPPHTLLLILLTASIMAMQNPFVVKDDAGFALSFLAFFGLAELGPMLVPKMKFVKSDNFKMITAQTFGAQIATLPYLLGGFGQLSLAGPLVNLIVIPLIPLIMAAGLITVGLSLIPLALTKALAGLMYFPLHAFLWFVNFASNIPGVFVAVPKGGLFPYYLGAIILFWWIYEKNKALSTKFEARNK